MHEPREAFRVRAGQLVQWLGRRGAEETIGTSALKRRVQELLRKQTERTTGKREKKQR